MSGCASPRRVVAAGCILSLAWLTSAQSPAPAPRCHCSIATPAADFDAVVSDLDAITDVQQLLDDLKDHADAWLAAGGTADRARREIAAATFALEAARIAEWREWKWIQKPPQYGSAADAVLEARAALDRVGLRAAAQKSDTGHGRTHLASRGARRRSTIRGPAVLDRHHPDCRGARRVWSARQSAASAVRGSWPWSRSREPAARIGHLRHSRERFPAEPRFLLAEGIARDRWFPNEAALAYGQVVDDLDVGGEALVRLGGLHLQQNQLPRALEAFDRAERVTRDTYVVHLARFFRGQILLRQKREEAALEAFRGAVAARPGAQSASVILAELLFKAGIRTEAQQVMSAVLANPAAGDPYLDYAHADDRFWPELRARLRREIKP